MFDDLRARFKCVFFKCDYRPDRAENLIPNGATRHHRDGTEEPIDACDIVDKCARCGNERRVRSPVSIAERHDVPFEWESDLW